MKFDKKYLIWLLVIIVAVGGYLFARQPAENPENTVNSQGNTVAENIAENSNTASNNASQNSNIASNNASQNDNSVSENTSQNTGESDADNKSENTANNSNIDNVFKGPVYYNSDILDTLTGTDIFNSTAIEHIFIGTVNSKGNGSGYHYAMISDAKGEIIESTKSKPDKNGLYTANVEVDGHPKKSFSTFYPDDWTPQEVVDAIAAARADALKTGKMSGDYHVGYYNGIQINMYLDSKNRVVTAYPVYNKGK